MRMVRRSRSIVRRRRALPFWRSLHLALLVGTTLAIGSAAASPPQRTRSVQVYGDDPCPRAAGDEIVVCGREPETERYRIPKVLRERGATAPERAWSDRVATLDEVSRAALPNSCSPVGSGGQTGCFSRFRDQWRAERRMLGAQEAASD